MTRTPRPRITPVACPFGSHGSSIFVYHIATSVPVLIDCGHHTSPSEVIAPTLADAGIELGQVRLVLGTHGHYDHIGGARAIVDQLGAGAVFALNSADLPLLRDAAEHRRTYAGFPLRWTPDPDQERALDENLETNVHPDLPIVPVDGGEHWDLGGGALLEAVPMPGHTPGSTAFLLQPWGVAFVGDAVQMHGGSGQRFPLITDPGAYRASIAGLIDRAPTELLLGHRTLGADRVTVHEPTFHGTEVLDALAACLSIEAEIAAVAGRLSESREAAQGSDPAWVARCAEALGYSPDPTGWPSSIGPTMLAYRPPQAPR